MKTIQPHIYSQISTSHAPLQNGKHQNSNDNDHRELIISHNLSQSDTQIPTPNTSLNTHNKHIVDAVCQKIIQLINDDTPPKICYSEILSKSLSYHYTYLSNLFTSTKGTTIQQFIIYHKIERVKKMLMNEQSNLTEIAYTLNYSSVAHLSNQFKKVTGLSPSQFKLTKQF